jgi:FHA domain
MLQRRPERLQRCYPTVAARTGALSSAAAKPPDPGDPYKCRRSHDLEVKHRELPHGFPRAPAENRVQSRGLLMSKPRRKLTGRPTTDARGNSTWKWTGESEVGTTSIRALADGLAFEPPQEADLNPYNQSTSQREGETKGRSLDDMRRLSDDMKREHAELVKSVRRRTLRNGPARPLRGMRLRFDGRDLLVDERCLSVSIGRAEDNDVVMMRERISRIHARIEIRSDKFLLIDLSTNGTYVQNADGEVSFVRRGRLQLKGQGMIGFGRRPKQGEQHTILFTCDEV